MSEEKIDVKKLTISRAIDLFFDGKIPKNDLKEAFDKRSLFKLDSKKLEDVLYAQRKDPSMFPKKLRIKSSDIVYEYGRTMSAGQLMNLASKGYVSEKDLLKALQKSNVITILAAVAEKDSKADDKEKSKKEIKPEQKEDKENDELSQEATTQDVEVESPVLPEGEAEVETEVEAEQEEKDFSEDDILQKEDVAEFFTADRLLKMFFVKKMTREFKEAYDDAFKGDAEFTESRSKDIIKELKRIFKDNLQALFIIIMRLHFKGIILSKDIEEEIKSEFFREKIFEPCDEYDVLDRDGNVIYSYKKIKPQIDEPLEQEASEEQTLLLAPEETREDESEELDIVPETEDYHILEPLTREEVVEAYRDSAIDNELFKRFFTMAELLQMYKQRKISVKIFALFDENKRKSEILKAYEEGYIHLEEIMELFFYHDGISAKELKSIIREMPKRVAIVRFITVATGFNKIFELYKNKLIDFDTLCTLKDQLYISEEEFEVIRRTIDKEAFYANIESTVFYTRIDNEPKVEELPEPEKLPEVEPEEEKTNEPIVDISDGEKVLLTKVLGIFEEEIQKISIIDSKDEDGNPTSLDGYQIISDEKDGLVIFGKFDYTSPILVMGYEEAAYFLGSRDDENENYIYDDLLFIERLENNNQVCVVEHDENMGKSIVQALCTLSDIARDRYADDEQYIAEVREFIRAIDDKYLESVKDANTNM